MDSYKKLVMMSFVSGLLIIGQGCRPAVGNQLGTADGAAADADADGDGDGDRVDSDFEWDNTCDSQEFDISMAPGKVMILLDQSFSMKEDAWSGHTHWQETINGLTALLQDPNNQETYFGLDPFPDGSLEYLETCQDECCDDPVCIMGRVQYCLILGNQCDRGCAVDLPPHVPLALPDVSGPAILEYVNLPFVPASFSFTPLVDQLRYYLTDRSAEIPELYTNDGSAFLVMLSDGEDTCYGDSDNTGAKVAALTDVTAQLLETWGIRSFAIGFGDTGGEMASQLNAVASNGGTEFPTFFSITEAGSLQEAFNKIAGSIVSCVYAIDEPDVTADPEAVNFFFDDEIVGMNVTCDDGWRWTDDDHDRVEFCGPHCQALQAHEVTSIEARFGCSTVVW